MVDDPFPPVRTARLTLRCVAAADAAATSALMTPEVSRWLADWPLPFTPDMAAARIETMRRCAVAGDVLPVAVVEQVSGALAGWIVLRRDGERRRRGSLGYWLGEAHHRRGYMREAIPAVLRVGFARLDLDVIEAAAQRANAGSFAVMRACGMRSAGEGMIYAPSRDREELCCFHEIARPRDTHPHPAPA